MTSQFPFLCTHCTTLEAAKQILKEIPSTTYHFHNILNKQTKPEMGSTQLVQDL